MKTSTLISVLAVLAGVAAAGPVHAQDLTIDGARVPDNQIQAVQDRCNTLDTAGQAGAGVTSVPAPATSPSMAPPASPSTTPPAAAGAAPQADPSTPPVAGATPPAAGAAAPSTPPDTSVPANAGSIDVQQTVELESLTLEMCQEGGFSMTPAATTPR